MADYYTGMWTLLNAIKSKFLEYQSTTLSSIKTYKLGIMPPRPAFPAISILPVSERLYSPKSDGTYRSDKVVNIEIYHKGLKLEDVSRTNRDMIDYVKDVLYDNYRLKYGGEYASYDTVIDVEIISEPQNFKDSIIMKSTIPITCKTFEQITKGNVTTSIEESDGKDLLDEIYSTIDAYSFTNAQKKIGRGTVPPTILYPSIYVVENTNFPERYEAGIDRPNSMFSISVFEKMLDKEYLLRNLITTIDDVKTCLFNNQRFSNKVRTSWVQSVDYGFFTAGETLLYSANVNLFCWKWDKVRLYDRWFIRSGVVQNVMVQDISST